MTASDDDTLSNSVTPSEGIEKIVPRLKKRRFGPLKVSNQIPKSRRLEIEKGLEESTKISTKWTREGGVSNHNFLKKRI